MTSLRKMLLWTLLPALAVTEIATSVVAYRNALIEANELFDAKLAQSSRILAALVSSHLDEGDVPPGLAVDGLMLQLPGRDTDLATSSGHVYESKVIFQVVAADGRLLLRSGNAPSVAVAPGVSGFADLSIEDQPWRGFVLRDAGRIYLAAERTDIRGELAGEIALGTLLPLLISLPLLTLLIVLMVNRCASSLRELAGTVEQRRVDDLAPIANGKVPTEVRGLIDAINGLMQRIEQLIERERRFSADAAHELRTPISALKLHAQNLQSFIAGAEMATIYQQLMRGFDRCERLIERLLDLTRLEQSAAFAAEEVDLAHLARETVALLAPSALRQGVELILNAPEKVVVRGQPLLLSVLLRNLIDNALRHGDGEVEIGIEGGARPRLIVTDQGPGLDEAARERVLERFHREADAGPGTGLGLSIAQRIAAAHGAELVLTNGENDRGLRAEVRF
jgi:two-component system sensor histidine kinase QseC